jgi:hypothetical protein
MHRERQLHAAVLVIGGRGGKAGFGEMAQRLLHFRDHHRLAVLETRLVLVALAGMRGEVLAGHIPCCTQHGGEGFARMVGKARPLRQLLHVEQVEQQEFEFIGHNGQCIFLKGHEGSRWRTLARVRVPGCRVGRRGRP